MNPTGKLDGKVAVVTGAGRGVGRAIAYAQEGACVCCAARSLAQIQETAATIHQAGGQSLAVSWARMAHARHTLVTALWPLTHAVRRV